MVRWLKPQGHRNLESARKRHITSFGYNLSSVNQPYQPHRKMVAPRHVQAMETIEVRMEKVRLEYEQMQ